MRAVVLRVVGEVRVDAAPEPGKGEVTHRSNEPAPTSEQWSPNARRRTPETAPGPLPIVGVRRQAMETRLTGLAPIRRVGA